MRKFLFLASLLLSACTCDMFSKDWTCPQVVHQEWESTIDVISYAENYMNYLKQVGKVPLLEIKKLPHPFQENCRKTIGADVVAINVSELLDQLVEVRKLGKSWELEVLEIISSMETKSATIRYVIKTQALGAFMVIKVIRFDNIGRVREIIEVFSPLDNN